MRKRFLPAVIAALILTAGICFEGMICEISANDDIGSDSEILTSTCANGIRWEYSSGIFTLKNVNILSENLSTDDRIICAVGIYSKSDRLLAHSIAYTDNSDTVELPCAIKDTTEFRLKIFFWKNTLTPLCAVEVFDIATVSPTCGDIGYQSVYSHSAGTNEIFNVTSALGHSYVETELITPAGIIECGQKKYKCTNCAATKEDAYYSDTDIARLCMYGDLTGIGKKSEVPITVLFEGEGKKLDNYALLKYQGHTSLIYDKKNFTLKLFKDELRTQKNKIVFHDWNKEHKYILKANYVDPSVCRNLVSANVWSEMVACRTDHSARLDACSNYGATDGFPVLLYLNDKFIGLYTMTLHRDDDLFDMDDDVYDAIAVTNTNHYDESRFKDKASFSENSDWEVEFNGLSDDTWVEEKLNRLIDFVRTSSDEDFKSSLGSYMDVNSAIDYLIAIYSLGIIENGSKNMTFATYSNEEWIMSLCDMECAFGLYSDGSGYYAPEHFLPVYDGQMWDSATDSLLWDRILNNYEYEIKARYAELRTSILTVENIYGKAAAFTAPIPKEAYEADASLYTDMPKIDISPLTQIGDYISKRLALLDKIFTYHN